MDAVRGARFREARLKAGLTQAEAAQAAPDGVTQGTISRWERGFGPDWAAVDSLIEVYDCDPHWLRYGQAGSQSRSTANPYPAWAEFERTPEAQAAPAWALDQLRVMRWPKGKAPTMGNYLTFLAAYLAVGR